MAIWFSGKEFYTYLTYRLTIQIGLQYNMVAKPLMSYLWIMQKNWLIYHLSSYLNFMLMVFIMAYGDGLKTSQVTALIVEFLLIFYLLLVVPTKAVFS